jgi:uncharacterized DUF497 family protein
VEITWDDAKAEDNARKHGVTFEEAATALADPQAQTFPDYHESDERLISVGCSAAQRLLLIVWCERSDDVIRIISARKATPRERETYEEGI